MEKYNSLVAASLVVGFGTNGGVLAQEADDKISKYLDGQERYQDRTTLVSGVENVLEQGVPVGEFDDTTPEFNPVITTIEAYKQITRQDGISKWAPVSLIKNGQSTIRIPRYTIGVFSKSKLTKETEVNELDVKQIDSIVGQITPEYTPETIDYLDAEVIRSSPYLPEDAKTSSFITGKATPINILTTQLDANGGQLDETDLLAPGGRIVGMNVKIKNSDDVNEIIRLNPNEIISTSNIFTGAVEGDTKLENLKAKFKFIIDANTMVISSGEDINTGKRVASVVAADLTVGSYVVEINIAASLMRGPKRKELTVEFAKFSIIKKIVSGVSVEIPADDPIYGIPMTLQSTDFSLQLTNTNDRAVGVSTIRKEMDYAFKTENKGLFSDPLPKDKSDAIMSVAETIGIQNGLIKIAMEKDYVKSLEEFKTRLKLSIAMGEKPNTICDVLRPVFLESNVTGVNPTVMRTSENPDEKKALVEQAIEKIGLELIAKSGWNYVSKLYNVTGVIVKVLVPQQLNLGDFKFQDGTPVKVAYTDQLKTEIKVSLEAVGGPTLEDTGSKMFTFSEVLMTPPVTYVTTKGRGNGIIRSVTTQPNYTHIFKMPVLGEITL